MCANVNPFRTGIGCLEVTFQCEKIYTLWALLSALLGIVPSARFTEKVHHVAAAFLVRLKIFVYIIHLESLRNFSEELKALQGLILGSDEHC